MMLPGEVVRIRVNPRDCMSVVDVINNTGMYTGGMSFPMAVSLVLSSLLESARQAKLIPERDGFEYSEVMQPFSNKATGPRKLAITAAHRMVGSELVAPPLRQPKVGMSMEQRRADTRMRELFFKREHTPESWSPADDKELDQVIAVAMGDPPAPKGTS